MLTFLQIVIVLFIIAVVAIILGYLLGKVVCVQKQDSHYEEKGRLCEEEFLAKLGKELEEITPKEQEDKENKIQDELNQEQLLKEEKANQNNSLQTSQTLINSQEQKSKDEQAQNIKDKSNEQNKLNSNQDNLTKSKEDKTEEKINTKNANQETQEKETLQDKTDKEISNQDTQENQKSLQKKEIKKSGQKDSFKEKNSESKGLNLIDKEKIGRIEGKEPDNLTLIKGIGTVIAKKLNDLGIYYFEQIAAWQEEDIAKIDQYLSFKGRIKREKWVEQAQNLAKGIESEFAKRVKEGKVASSKA